MLVIALLKILISFMLRIQLTSQLKVSSMSAVIINYSSLNLLFKSLSELITLLFGFH